MVSAMTPRPLHDPSVKGFASDNYSGVHPEVLAALTAANGGHAVSYGEDPYTHRLQEVLRHHFGEQATAYPVFNGTGANVIALSAMTQRWESVICSTVAHVHTDECGAAEKAAGLKLAPVDTVDGRLTPELVAREAYGFGFVHHAQPAVVTVTQSTELGTLYRPDEIAAVARYAHERGMRVHLDGARLANAAAALDLPLRALTTDVGVDVVSLGATKNGAMGAEAVVVLNPDAVDGLPFVRKLQMQLASKMRFVSAQLVALFEGDLWSRSAAHANAMAARLAERVRGIPGVQITREPEVNAVFAVLDPAVTARLQKQFPFYVWDEATRQVRWMTSFDTTEAEVDAFALEIERRTGLSSAAS